MDDKAILELVDKVKDTTTPARIAVLESENQNRVKEIQELKAIQKEKGIADNNKKDKIFTRIFVVISCLIATIGLIISILNFITK